MDPTEPEEVRDLFLGTSMRCTYQKGAFPEDLLTTMTGSFDRCEGDLKENILFVLALLSEEEGFDEDLE